VSFFYIHFASEHTKYLVESAERYDRTLRIAYSHVGTTADGSD